VYNVYDAGNYVLFVDSTHADSLSLPKNSLRVSYNVNQWYPQLTVSSVYNNSIVAVWYLNSIYILAPNMDSGFRKLNTMIFGDTLAWGDLIPYTDTLFGGHIATKYELDSIARIHTANIYNSDGTIPANTNRTVTVDTSSKLIFNGWTNLFFVKGNEGTLIQNRFDSTGRKKVGINMWYKPDLSAPGADSIAGFSNSSYGIQLALDAEPVDFGDSAVGLLYGINRDRSRQSYFQIGAQNAFAKIALSSPNYVHINNADSVNWQRAIFNGGSGIGSFFHQDTSDFSFGAFQDGYQFFSLNAERHSLNILDANGATTAGLIGSAVSVQSFVSGVFNSRLAMVANVDGAFLAYVDTNSNDYTTYYPKYLTGNYKDTIPMGSGVRVLTVDGVHATPDGNVNTSGGSGGWGLTGNAGTSYPPNMIGASDGALNVVGSLYTFDQAAIFASNGIGGMGAVFINDSIHNCNTVVGCGFADSGFAILSSDLGGSSDSTVGITGNWKTNNIRFEFIGPAYYNLPKTSPTLGQIAVADASNNLTWQKVPNLPHTIFTPTTGATITAIDNQMNIVNPAAPILALTINLPATPADNDRVEIKFDQAVSNVTYGGGTVLGGLVSPIIGSVEILTYDSGTSTWY
jgi:hypothetical protein